MNFAETDTAKKLHNMENTSVPLPKGLQDVWLVNIQLCRPREGGKGREEAEQHVQAMMGSLLSLSSPSTVMLFTYHHWCIWSFVKKTKSKQGSAPKTLQTNICQRKETSEEVRWTKDEWEQAEWPKACCGLGLKPGLKRWAKHSYGSGTFILAESTHQHR